MEVHPVVWLIFVSIASGTLSQRIRSMSAIFQTSKAAPRQPREFKSVRSLI